MKPAKSDKLSRSGELKPLECFEPFGIPLLLNLRGDGTVDHKTKRTTLETRRVGLRTKIMKYGEFARGAPDPRTKQRIEGLIAELEKQLREIDE